MNDLTSRDMSVNRDIVDEMKDSYINYSMSVIVSRALPDVRDGLKPIHRRILYGMNELGSQWNRPYKKSARIVGDVMGKYHPHGDSSIYDSLVRMAQYFSMRHELVDGQGNFGSVDGDNAAAMRYTEARMTRFGAEMLRDLEKDTVDWQPNFDETLQEPTVLPTVIPNLLVNGSEGIAVGMATKIPPHNLTEIINSTVAFIDNPDITIDELMEFTQGPDFPTGGTIEGLDGIKEAYKTGRGKIRVRANAFIETLKGSKSNIVVNEIPYQVNKASLIEKIADLVRSKKVEGIADIRDESDKDGMRIVVETKRDVVPEVILNQLYVNTQMKDTFGVILLALVDGVPKVLNLKEVIKLFVDHRHDVLIRRTNYELNQAEARAHILEGLKVALENIDQVIDIIKGSKDPKQAKEGLINAFDLTEKQCQAILDMRLQRLTGLEVDKINQEYKEIIQLISELKGILDSHTKQMSIIKSELVEISEKYGEERKTEIVPVGTTFSVEDMIVDEDVVLTFTHNGYVKRTAASTYRSQRRGGRGLQGAGAKEEDFVENIFVASTHDHILFFSDKGKCYWLKVHEIPPGGRASKGRAVVNMLGTEPEERIKAFVSVKNFDDEHHIIMATKNGKIKKTSLSAYSKPRKGGIYAIKINDGDELIEARITNGENDIILGTREGKSIRFPETDARPQGRNTQGVTGIKLSSKDDCVVGMVVVRREGTILVATEKGFGKRTDVMAFRVQKRAGMGVMAMRTNEKVGKMVAIMEVVDSDDLMVITDRGVLIRQPIEKIRTIGRVTQGVKLIKLDEGSKISSLSRVIHEEDDEDLETPDNSKIETKDEANDKG